MIDWTALGEEAVDLLRRYLAIDTTNPPGNEIEGARFVASVLAEDGITSETAESAPGRANLVAKVAGDATGDGRRRCGRPSRSRCSRAARSGT